jgi:hypothetical protein
MTESEIIEMMYESLGYADRNFEFWISASFGVILAFHFSGERVTPLMHRLITFLYCSATVLFVSRWSVAALQYAQFRQELIDMGSSVKVSSLLMESVISVAYLLVICIGTVGTIYFGYKATKKV